MDDLNQYQELLSRFEQAVHGFNMTVNALVIPDHNDLDRVEKTEAMLQQLKVYEDIILELQNGLVETNRKLKF